METETNLPDNDFTEEEWIWFGTEIYKALSPCIKQFLIGYFGERFYTLESETYREVESIIRENIESDGDSIPDILYRNRTIRDSNLWNEALDKFAGKITPVNWPKNPHWSDRISLLENDDDDDFLADIPESELTEDQKLAKLIVADADDILNFHIGFANFMKQGFEVLIPAMQTYIEDVASFDLSVLSPEGYELLQMRFEMIADRVFDHLYGLLHDQM